MEKNLRLLLAATCLPLSIYSVTLKEKYPIDFFEAMGHSKHFNVENAKKNSVWQFLAKLYDNGMSAQINTNSSVIPRVFHLIWLGGNPPSRYQTITKQLKNLHPNCQVKLWTDKEANSYKMVNRAVFNAAHNFGEKSDIWRYEILFNEGGVYFDGDFEIVKSFDDILSVANFFIGLAYDQRILFYNGLIGCQPNHPIMKLAIDDIGTAGSKNDPEDIMMRTGPYHITRCFLQHAVSSPGVTIAFPVTFFYAWPNYALYESASPQSWAKEYTFAFHLWARSWVKET